MNGPSNEQHDMNVTLLLNRNTPIPIRLATAAGNKFRIESTFQKIPVKDLSVAVDLLSACEGYIIKATIENVMERAKIIKDSNTNLEPVKVEQQPADLKKRTRIVNPVTDPSIMNEIEQDLLDGSMPVGETESCLAHWKNKYHIVIRTSK